MTAPMFCLLLLATLAVAQDDPDSDSLKSALEAISRRQRDLAASGGSGRFAGLSQYRFPELGFLAPPRDFSGDGQPENIGYGYQKSVPTATGVYSSSPQLLREGASGDHHDSTTNKALEKLLVEYLEDEYKNGNTGDNVYYRHGEQQDSKRSAFRERGGGDFLSDSEARFHPTATGRLEEIRKRGNAPHSLLPSSFRERVHSRLVGDEDNFEAEKRRHNFAKALAKELEEEEEEIIEKEREEQEEEEKEGEYLDLLHSLWEKYKQSNPSVVDIEDLTPGDVQELLGSLGDVQNINGENIEGLREEAVKRQYGGSYDTGYDYFNNGGGMGGWGGGGQYKKRGKQRLDGLDNQQGNFLYSLKFVSPATNREAIETLKEDDSIELPDERDEDLLRLASNNFNRQEPEVWVPTYEREEPIEDVYGPNEENYQRLLLSSQNGLNQHSPSRKRISSLVKSNYGLRPLASTEFLVPERQMEKKYMYDAATKRKRYPVTKRSSNFYTSPPLLHHKSFSPTDNLKETRKKKDASIGTANTVTDPKVARELNQIFSSSPITNEDLSEENAHGSKITGAVTPATKSDSKQEQEITTHASVIPSNSFDNSSSNNSPDNSKAKKDHVSDENINNGSSGHIHNDKENFEPNHQEQSLREEETVEQPITMSRIQTPLEIKKKSIDWSDYFGIDRRRKKASPVNTNEMEGSGDGGVVDDDWLMNEYYKTLAMSTNVKKRMPFHNNDHDHVFLSQSKDKKENGEQPFDTRLFDADIFSRSAQREDAKRSNQQKDSNDESRIENMDSKLRNIEDVIVNEAVKYTGAHEGSTDPKEIQEVKDKIMSRLAAAYSLEKMRLALREFKSSLQAQKMSKYNPENQRSSRGGQESDDDKKNKRVAVKKEKAEEENKEEGKEEEEKKKKRDEVKKEIEDDNTGEFLNGLSDIEPLSEGYMGRSRPTTNHEDCPLLNHILQKCHSVSSMSGDHGQLFLPLCSLHQICYLCGPEVGYPSPSACDLMFLTEADAMCMGDAPCQQVARRSAMTLRRSQPESGNEQQCWSNSCLARYFLTSPLPNNQAR